MFVLDKFCASFNITALISNTAPEDTESLKTLAQWVNELYRSYIITELMPGMHVFIVLEFLIFTSELIMAGIAWMSFVIWHHLLTVDKHMYQNVCSLVSIIEWPQCWKTKEVINCSLQSLPSDQGGIKQQILMIHT